MTSKRLNMLCGIECNKMLPIPIKKISIEKVLLPIDLSKNKNTAIIRKEKLLTKFKGSEKKSKPVLSQ